ncbi:MAG: MotA/TolQ/ExbB proton channel family protein [Verrucomicrobiota bacterium]|nr:MotA/TolQ/ExbB proton channel family protein [Verrucomicrobiota bacterium]
MPDFILKGGVFIMVPLVACMIVSLGIIMERAFALRRSLLISSSVARAVELFKSPDDLDRLIRLCQSDDSGLSRLIQTALDHLGWPKTENMEAVTTKARAEVNRMERGLVALEIFVGIGPLLGLLGTVFGMMHIFEGLGNQGSTVQTMAVAKGIAEALNATVAGLIVAVPSLIAWSYFMRKIESTAVEMENICADLLSKLYRTQ